MSVPLRQFGPRVFLSYSFADAVVAQKIESHLVHSGFQVHREDERSLAGAKLSVAIPKRIADAEVLIQVLTSTANRSAWVQKEFRFAEELNAKKKVITILPIVFDKTTLFDEVRDWWFLDLCESGLTPGALEQIESVCLQSVHLLPLSTENPFEFDRVQVRSVLQKLTESDDRRIIVDSNGMLLGWALETLQHFQCVEPTPTTAQFLKQEQARSTALASHLKCVDEVTRRLCLAALDTFSDYDEPAERAVKPVMHFVRALMGDILVQAAQVAPPVPHALRTSYAKLVQEVERSNSPQASEGYRNPGLTSWAFGIRADDEIVEMGIDAEAHRGVPVNVPRSIFGSMADAYSQGLSFDPTGELLGSVFADYILPQIAIHAAYNLTDVKAIRSELTDVYAWKLKEYHRMGLA
jgi:TIR domain